MADPDDFRELQSKIEDGTIAGASKEQIEKYTVLLSKHGAFDKFTDPRQFPQVCETIRMLLLKKYTEEINKQTADMQNMSLKLQRKGNRLQVIVAILAGVTITMAGLQIYVTLRPSPQLQEQTQLQQELKEPLTDIQKSFPNPLKSPSPEQAKPYQPGNNLKK